MLTFIFIVGAAWLAFSITLALGLGRMFRLRDNSIRFRSTWERHTAQDWTD